MIRMLETENRCELVGCDLTFDSLTALDPEHGASIYYAHDVMLEPMIFRSVDLPIGTN